MANAVFYEPTSPRSRTGRIVAVVSAPIETIKADGRAFVEVDEYHWDYDATHKVVNGKLAPLPPEER